MAISTLMFISLIVALKNTWKPAIKARISFSPSDISVIYETRFISNFKLLCRCFLKPVHNVSALSLFSFVYYFSSNRRTIITVLFIQLNSFQIVL